MLSGFLNNSAPFSFVHNTVGWIWSSFIDFGHDQWRMVRGGWLLEGLEMILLRKKISHNAQIENTTLENHTYFLQLRQSTRQIFHQQRKIII